MLNLLEIFWQNSANISEKKSRGKKFWFSQCLKYIDNDNKNNCAVMLSGGFSGLMFQSIQSIPLHLLGWEICSLLVLYKSIKI